MESMTFLLYKSVWAVDVAGAHMACRLSAVSVFHRISLAGRFSVSSNNDDSKSTLASGVSGDLLQDQFRHGWANGTVITISQRKVTFWPVGINEVLVLHQRIDLLHSCWNLLMDFHNLLWQQTADLAILLQDAFTAITHSKKSTEGKSHVESASRS